MSGKIDIHKFKSEFVPAFLEDLQARSSQGPQGEERDGCFLCKWILSDEDPAGAFTLAARVSHLGIEFPEKFERLYPGLRDRLIRAMSRKVSA